MVRNPFPNFERKALVMKDISDILTVDRIRDLKAQSKDGALRELCSLASTSPKVSDPEAFLKAILARETAMSTGIGMGIAIPHAKNPSMTDFVMAVGRSLKGIDFDSLDSLPVHIIILVGSSDKQNVEFLKLIAKIGALFNEAGFKERFLKANTPEEMYKLLTETNH
jgi:mannitol/fructose-specific phosphotransferase system IIA component (Ntr-type)